MRFCRCIDALSAARSSEPWYCWCLFTTKGRGLWARRIELNGVKEMEGRVCTPRGHNAFVSSGARAAGRRKGLQVLLGAAQSGAARRKRGTGSSWVADQQGALAAAGQAPGFCMLF